MRVSRFRLAPTAWSAILPFTMLLMMGAGCESMSPQRVEVTTHQGFVGAWESRLEKYRSDFTKKDAEIRGKAGRIIDAEVAASADPWKMVVPRVFELSLMIRDAFTIAGRGEAIKAFIQHMQTGPTPGLTDVWFQRQAEDLQQDARNVDTKTQAFLGSFDEKLRRGPEWMLEAEELARSQGMVAGRIEELQSLHKQAISYFKDMQQAGAEDSYRAEQQAVAQAQAARVLLGTAVYLNQVNYQQQLLNTLNRPRTCSFFANMMTCQ